MPEAVAAADVETWAAELSAVADRLAPLFARSEPRRHAAAYLRALLGDCRAQERLAGRRVRRRRDPYGVQHLLGRADWDADAVRDDLLRRYVMEHLADPGGVLVVDETGFLKKGTKSAGVQRQYSRHRRPDRELPGRRLPRLRRPPRPGAARPRAVPAQGVGRRRRPAQGGRHPEGVRVRHQAGAGPADARAGVRGGREGDVGDGRRGVRQRRQVPAGFLEEQGQPYVLAVRSDQRCGRTCGQVTVSAIAGGLPARRGGKGSAGRRVEGAAAVRLGVAAVRAGGRARAGGCGCWSGASAAEPEERAYYLCRGPAGTSRAELVRVAGARWPIEECFERGKGEVRAGRLRGAQLGRLVPARHAVDARPGGARGGAVAGRVGAAKGGR